MNKHSQQCGLAGIKRIFIYVMVGQLLMAFPSLGNSFGQVQYKTTYEKFLAKAFSGDSKAQNFIAYMHFYGEGAPLDYNKAHHWFHVAAESGEVTAQRNLGLFHARALLRIPEMYFDAEESNMWLSKAESKAPDIDLEKRSINYQANIEHFDEGSSTEIGKRLYQGYCAGCHGFKGVASFKLSPSFAKGERLEKSDTELLTSISDGKGIMPAWKKVLSKKHRKDVLNYIRLELNQRGADETQTSRGEPLSTAGNGNKLGQKAYNKYCAGCHGFNGISYYVDSPSLALGERMEKSNAVLLRSINNGINIMPGWDNKLSKRQIHAVMKYIRTLAVEFNVGIDREINKPKESYYTFKPSGGS